MDNVKQNITLSESQNNNNTNGRQEVRILCLDLTAYSRSTRFLISCTGVFALYLLYGYLQELIFSGVPIENFGWLLTLIQFGYYVLFGLMERHIEIQRRKTLLPSGQTAKSLSIQRCIPMRIYVILSALTLGTMGLSNSSLAYLNYPTQVIFKCCKLIPVLIGSILIQGKKYGPLDFAAAICMCAGLTWFTLADSKVSPNFSSYGIIMISGALLCDAAIGNVQEKAMCDYRAPSSEVVLYSYGLGFLYLFVILFFTGDLIQGIYFCLQHAKHTFGLGFLFSLSGYLGIHFVLALVRSSGAPIAATVTTARKAVSIIISFLFFSKPFTWHYLWAGFLVVFGIYLNVASKKYKFEFKDIQHILLKSASQSQKSLINV